MAEAKVLVTYVGPLPEVITRRGIVFVQGEAQECSKALADALCGPDTEFVVGVSAKPAEAAPVAPEVAEETDETEDETKDAEEE